MASFQLSDDEKEFLVCGICLEIYDEEARVPKLLKCHHTCCLACLKGQANSQKINCPYCRQTTCLENLLAVQLTTNFYVLPKIQRLTALRARYEGCRLMSKDNWAHAIALRRDVESKLQNVHDALRLLESLVLKQKEENNEQIAILQSLIEEPETVEIEDLINKDTDNWEKAVEKSKLELLRAQELSDVFLRLEKYTYALALEDQSGQKFAFENLYKQPISFNSSSTHGPYVNAAQSMLSFIIHQLTERKLMKPMECLHHNDGNPGHTESSLSSLKPNISFSLNPSCPNLHAYLQLRVNGIVKPIVVIQLDMQEAPLMGQAFLDYCRGDENMTYKGTRIHKIGDSIIGGKFSELKPLKGKASRDEKELRYTADWSRLEEVKGVVRMRFRGRNGQGVLASSEFSIICSEKHRNDDQITTVFGRVVQGMEVCEEMTEIDPMRVDIVIAACGSWPIV